jgi:hypothetical protein
MEAQELHFLAAEDRMGTALNEYANMQASEDRQLQEAVMTCELTAFVLMEMPEEKRRFRAAAAADAAHAVAFTAAHSRMRREFPRTKHGPQTETLEMPVGPTISIDRSIYGSR